MISELIASVENQIGYITLNRPEAHNAVNLRMWEAIPQTLEQLKSRVKVIVITGQGNSFASGADLSELEQLRCYEDSAKNWKAISDCLNLLWSFELPTIAMINGACLGGGCLLALACDLRYAAASAIFGIPVSKLGIILDNLNISRLVSTVGAGNARELLYSGDTISSARAETIGLINAVYDTADLKARVQTIAGTISRNAASSIASAKRSINTACLGMAPANPEESAIITSYLHPEFRQRLQNHLSRKQS